jgi:hypothetical protein
MGEPLDISKSARSNKWNVSEFLLRSSQQDNGPEIGLSNMASTFKTIK